MQLKIRVRARYRGYGSSVSKFMMTGYAPSASDVIAHPELGDLIVEMAALGEMEATRNLGYQASGFVAGEIVILALKGKHC